MSSQPAVEFRNVWKTFHRHMGQLLLRSHFKRLLTWKDSVERFHALRDVSFQVEHGESLAVMGKNGAGKSTLLSLVAGLVPPDRGAVLVQGRVAALLELGSGFHPDLTGMENIRLNAALLGFSRKQTVARLEEIVDFAEIADFIREPLRTYSTGMTMRLAFSVAVNLDPDILLIDEVLAVGDAGFQAKCFDRIFDFRRRGKTILCVSHAAGMAQQFCGRAVWLDHGELMLDGPVDEVACAYKGYLNAGS
jgi:ABC-type polysaccharide/polyol phosphate transport system ATPase subunit